MKSIFLVAFLCISSVVFSQDNDSTNLQQYDLVFTELATTWDEAIPLGNGMIGNLVWLKNGKLRFSLDRADIWDLRPMENIDFNKWKFKDVHKHWKNDTYREVQKAFDDPYDSLPAPSKIPAGAMEFDISSLGKVASVRLDIENASCVVLWENGAKLTTFVHANKPVGWYEFENLPNAIDIALISPAYNRESGEKATSQSRTDLNQLGYEQGKITRTKNTISYTQNGWENFSYQIFTKWAYNKTSLKGNWSISSKTTPKQTTPTAKQTVLSAYKVGHKTSFSEHLSWWKNYWNTSKISIPNKRLEKQYYLEMYKFGAAARDNTPPIALQAVWTADHGKLPPWKGDFHHDLNTQLSYWPAYAGNLLELEDGFLNWLWKYRTTFKKYTKDYFEADGLNVPGVTTLDGEPMGGWIQYSFGPTVSAWLGHHFYLHWRFSMDREFLKDKAYPWIKDVAIFLNDITVKEGGKRKLIMSSSPEIFNNSKKAWFKETTNFDLSLIRWTYEKAAELATELNITDEAEKWNTILAEWPQLAVDKESGFQFSPTVPYESSHRHFSHLMGYHPLGLVDFSKGKKDQKIILNTLKNLEKQGSDYWTGYSFSWLGNLYARAFDGENAERVLEIFSKCFCLKNSFHANGDQCKAGYSKYTYRPFTLEGNFAFASGIQEMLLQSHTGTVRLFPALPKDWKNASFRDFRTDGAFILSANLEKGMVKSVTIQSEKGGTITLLNPFKNAVFSSNKDFETKGNLLIFNLGINEKVELKQNL